METTVEVAKAPESVNDKHSPGPESSPDATGGVVTDKYGALSVDEISDCVCVVDVAPSGVAGGLKRDITECDTCFECGSSKTCV